MKNTDNKNAINEKDIEASAERIGRSAVPHKLKKPSGTYNEVQNSLKTIRRTIAGLKKNTDTIKNSKAAQWLLDNWYMAEGTAMRTIKRFKYSPKLPTDQEGKPIILTSSYELALLTEAKVNERILAVFLRGLQSVYPLCETELFMFIPAVTASVLFILAEKCKDEAVFNSDNGGHQFENIFTSLRFLDNYDSSELMEKANVVEHILSNDPAGIYVRMDERTRHQYRMEISKLARKNGISESETAEKVLSLSKEDGSHVGKYIFTMPLGKEKRRKTGIGYISVIVLSTLFLSLLLGIGLSSIFILFALIIPISELVKNIVDYIILRVVPPRYIPRLELKDGIPKSAKTVCVISTMLSGKKAIDDSIKSIRDMSITNRDGGPFLYFGLLADLPEADYEIKDEEKALIAYATAKIKRLNKNGTKFYLFIRKRSFSTGSGKYSGRERKRGAISALADFLSGDESEIICLGGDEKEIIGASYIITLDGDTKMCASTAVQLVGAALHPLNTPVVDEEYGCVISGAGIIQPKISVNLKAASKSKFTAVFAGLGGVDPYGSLASDIYQDLYDCGGFNGKGLINVPVYKMCLSDAFPDETVLSHDILEGAYIGSKYAGDIEFTDGYPYKVLSYYARMHRWVRGDWQNSPWLSKFVKNKKSIRRINPISDIDKWRIADNMRRSLVPIMTFVSIIVGLIYSRSYFITAAIIGILSTMSGLIFSSAELLVKRSPEKKSRYHSPIIYGPKAMALQTFYRLMLLPFEAYTCFSAILTSLYRMNISHRNMLAWVTSAESEKKAENTLYGHYIKMWFSVFAGALTAALSPAFVKWLFFALWIMAPAVSYFISKPISETRQLSFDDRRYLLQYGEKIWNFFKDNINAENSYLPPDNIQMDPPVGTAYRTSPTNIGLGILSCIAAIDLGFETKEDAISIIEKTVDTLTKMEKWHGHLYNWYDTRTLDTLVPSYISTVDSGNLLGCLIAASETKEIKERKELLAKIKKLIADMDFSPLYDKKTNLFYIGWDMRTGKPTDNHYDLMASEARQTSYISVARGVVPKKHWMRLSRMLAADNGYRGMVSWTGSMFEYLMPNLLLPCENNSLSYESGRFCIYSQMRRGGLKYPWGVSESCMYEFDSSMNYRYGPHGAPKLALKRDMDREMVVSPYSSFLASMLNPKPAVSNLRKLEKYGAVGEYGFYEAVDFTKSRQKDGQPPVVKTYMSHHMGMSLVAIDNVIESGIMQKRFLANEEMGAYAELLEERIPVGEVVLRPSPREVPDKLSYLSNGGVSMKLSKIDYRNPLVFPVTNGSYSTFISETGQTKSLWNGVLIARCSEDKFEEGGIDFKIKVGQNIYSMHPISSDSYCGHQVTYDGSVFKYEFENEEIKAVLETKVFDGMIGEKKTLSIINKKDTPVDAEVISYFEPVLQREQDFTAHPGFSKLQLEFGKKDGAIMISRRGDDGKPVMSACFISDRDIKFETSRLKVYGRNDPYSSYPLDFSGDFGRYSPECCVLSKVFLELKPGKETHVNYGLSVGFDKEGVHRSAVEILNNSGDGASCLKEGINSDINQNIFESAIKLLSMISDGSRKQRDYKYDPDCRKPRSLLWRYSISGDIPIVVVESKTGNEKLVYNVLRIKKLLSSAGVLFDLVVIEENGDTKLTELISKCGLEGQLKSFAGVFRIRKEDADAAIYDLAAAVLNDDKLKIKERDGTKPRTRSIINVSKSQPVKYSYDSKGEFSFDVRGNLPELVWSNIIAGPTFGTIASDNGGGFTWSLNSHENKMNRWENDRSAYKSSEKIEIEMNGERYSVFAAEDDCECTVKYGYGYAVWKKKIGEATIETTVFMPHGKNMKVYIIRGEKIPRDASLRYFTELVLSDRTEKGRWTVTSYNGGTLSAYSMINDSFKGFPFVLKTSGKMIGFTTDKSSWIFDELDGFTGTGADACFGAVTEFSGCQLIGVGCEPEKNIVPYLNIREAEKALQFSKDHWEKAVSRLKISTGNETFDRYVNGWGMYQTMACRLFARTSVYQNGGAFGFRDQLQDAVCALPSDPNILAEQILRCCTHQFVEGDVQHWWHPGGAEGTDPGVRTLCSDDYLWLPYAVCRYYEATGDKELLNTEVNFIESDSLEKDKTVKYELPQKSILKSSVLDHALRSCDLIVKRGFGDHGLCKILCGDWNDGMDYVGSKGMGESVWLTWFASIVLSDMAELMKKLGKSVQCENYKLTSKLLKDNAEKTYSGRWFLRGYYDDGKAIGVPGDDECEIDSISQSFAQFAGADEVKTKAAIFNAYNILFDKTGGVTKLFTPPFNNNLTKPGYIKRYCPGFRENGGQYTHGAIWLARALVETGEPDCGYMILNAALKNDGPNYKGEPFVVAADIYTAEGNYGRAGWSWYTGSAGWMYKTITESILGLKIRNGRLFIEPRLPQELSGYEAVYAGDNGELKISVQKDGDKINVRVNGEEYKKDGYEIWADEKYSLNTGKI